MIELERVVHRCGDRAKLDPLGHRGRRLANLPSASRCTQQRPNIAAQLSCYLVRSTTLVLELIEFSNDRGHEQNLDLWAAELGPEKIGKRLAVDKDVSIGNNREDAFVAFCSIRSA